MIATEIENLQILEYLIENGCEIDVGKCKEIAEELDLTEIKLWIMNKYNCWYDLIMLYSFSFLLEYLLSYVQEFLSLNL